MYKLLAKKLFTDGGVFSNRLIELDASGSTIVSVSEGSSTPEAGIPVFECLSAGFFDIHVNGGRRLHFSKDPDEVTIADIYNSSVDTGTAYVLPTLVTSSWENIMKGIQAMKSYQEHNPDSGVLGMHLEGPYLHPLKRGAHLESLLRKPTDAELAVLIKEGRDIIRLITVAPEIFTTNQLQMLLDSGIKVSAGHSNATYSEAARAFAQGIDLVTHLYNAMSSMNHRQPGIVGAVFDTPSVYAPIIVDGIHCDYAAARIAYKMKRDKLFLISDALFLLGEVREFQWGEFDAVLRNGEYRNAEGNLAGGAISLGDAVRNAVREVGIPLMEAIDMATLRPAKAMGLGRPMGRVAAGYPAVFTVFDDSLSHFQVWKSSQA